MKIENKLWAVIAITSASLVATSAFAVPSEHCDTETIRAMAPAETTVAFAAREYGGVCRVHGYVTTRDPGPNKVLFVLVMPDNFNGRYLYLGVGAAAGALPPIPADLSAKGYALAGSDGGTGATSAADFSFQSDPAKLLDYSWRAVHVSAGATQQIARSYYQRDSLNRYITGCSGGGQMGLTNAVRFGREDFDGFIVGATPFPGSVHLAQIFRVAQYLQKHPEGWISPDMAKRADAAILARYDDVDGAKDGMIADSRDIGVFDDAVLRGVGFTPAQIATFELIRSSHHYTGANVSGDGFEPGLSVSDIEGWSGFVLGTSPPPWPSIATSSPTSLLANGAPFIHVMTDTMVRNHFPGKFYVDITKETELTGVSLAEGAGAASNYDKLAASGAKIILYHGVNDQAQSYLSTLKSRADIAAKYPNSADWMRAFPIAGMRHCSGGPGPTDAPVRLLDAMVEWVEKGQAPDTVIAARHSPATGAVERTFRLCADPTRVALKQPGLDYMTAENWVCRSPAKGS